MVTLFNIWIVYLIIEINYKQQAKTCSSSNLNYLLDKLKKN